MESNFRRALCLANNTSDRVTNGESRHLVGNHGFAEKKAQQIMSRLLVLVVVFGIGISGAAMYRKPPQARQADTTKSNWDASLVLRDRDGEPPVVLPREVGGPQTPPTSNATPAVGTPLALLNDETDSEPALVQMQVPSRPTRAPRVEVATLPTPRRKKHPLEVPAPINTDIPPGIASSFGQAAPAPLPELSTTVNRQPLDDISTVTPRDSELTLDRESPAYRGYVPFDEQEERRMYVIRDGDSLESLAKRFLGGRDRAGEIQELNRDILGSLELLPVGVEIQLPPRHRRTDERVKSPRQVTNEATSINEATRKPTPPRKATIWEPVVGDISKGDKTKDVFQGGPVKAAPQTTTPRAYAPQLVPVQD